MLNNLKYLAHEFISNNLSLKENFVHNYKKSILSHKCINHKIISKHLIFKYHYKKYDFQFGNIAAKIYTLNLLFYMQK